MFAENRFEKKQKKVNFKNDENLPRNDREEVVLCASEIEIEESFPNGLRKSG
jgi:hypothetical protein